MGCNRVIGLFSAWRDGKLSEAGRADVIGHLETCPSCARQWAEYNEALDSLGSFPVEVPESFRKGWRQRVAAASAKPVPRVNPFSRVSMAWAAAACFAVVFLAGISGIWGVGRPGTGAGVQTYDSAASRSEIVGKMAQPLSAPSPEMNAAEAPMESISPPSGVVADDRKVMHSATLTLESRNVEPTCDEISEAARRFGGFVRSASVSRQAESRRSGHVSLAVPAGRFEDALKHLGTLGVVIQKDVTGQDVTEEYVDLQARLKNWRSQESQLNLIMTRARNVEEILAVQNELGRVREEIERLSGRIQYLDRKVGYADIDVSVVQPGNAKAPSAILEFLRELGRRLSGSLFAMISVIFMAAPWVALALVAFWIGRRWWMRSRG